MDTSPAACATCGVVPPPSLVGMCPRCLLRAGLEPPTSSVMKPGEAGPPRRFGNYELVECIAWWSLPFAVGAALVWLVFGWLRYRPSGQREEG